MIMKYSTIENLTDNVALITESGMGISKNDFIEQVKEGWISYLITLPLSNTIAEQVAVTTNLHKDHHSDNVSTAIEYFQEYKGEDLSDIELAMINVSRLFVEENNEVTA